MAGFSSATFSQLIDLIYDAALDPERWPTVVEAVSRATSARTALFSVDGQHGITRNFISTDVDPKLIETYLDHYAAQNPYTVVALDKPIGELLWAHELAAAETVGKSEFYHQFMKPAGFALNHVGIKFAQEPNYYAAIALSASQETMERDPGTYGDCLLRLGGHFSHALEINRRLGLARLSEASFEQTLHSIRAAAFVLDQKRHLLLANAMGKRLLDEDRVLKTDRFRELRACRPSDESNLAATLSHTGARGFPLPILSTRSGRQYLCWAIPLSIPGSTVDNRRKLWTEQLTPKAATLLLVTPKDLGIAIPSETIAAAFGLSAAEARLVAGLIAGRTLSEVASTWGLSPNTVRNQLSSVFAKIGVGRQSELVVRIFATLGLWTGSQPD